MRTGKSPRGRKRRGILRKVGGDTGGCRIGRSFFTGLVLAGICSTLHGQPCVSQSSMDVEPANSVNCGVQGVHEDTSYWRSFDLGAAGMTGPSCLQRVQIGIEEASSPCGRQPLTVRIYSDTDANPAPIAGLSLLDERTILVSDQQLSLIEVEFATPIPAGVFLVVEIFAPRGPVGTSTRFLMGTNQQPESSPSYLSANDCQLPEPVPIPALVPPGSAVRVVMEACLSSGACPCAAPAALACALTPGSTNVSVSWTNARTYDAIEIFVNGVASTALPGNTTSMTLACAAYVGTEVNIEVRGLAMGSACPGSRSCTVLIMPPSIPSAYEFYSAINTPVGLGSSVADNIYVPLGFTVGRVQVDVDITHPVQSDLVVRLASPNGTEVTLHENSLFRGGFYQPDLRLTYTDDGVDNCLVPSACDCPVMPFGPGMLADLSCQNASGTWLLTVEDLFSANDGIVNSWKLGLDASTTCCARPTNLQASSSCAADSVTLTWTNHALYDLVEIRESGSIVGQLLGPANSFVHLDPGDGVLDYELTVYCGGNAAHTLNIEIPHTGYAGETDVILALEGLQSGGAKGFTDSGAALASALQQLGRGVVVVRAAPGDFSCVANAQVIWVLTGTFPNDYRLTSAEGNWLASLSMQGKAIYFESGDHWGFNHIPSAFDQRDGVAHGLVLDGDDSLTQLAGEFAPGLDLTSFQGVAYQSDNVITDGTDQLVRSSSDSGGANSYVIWRNVPDGAPPATLPESDYIVGIFQDNDSGGDVIVTSWEFGGVAANRSQLASLYLSALVTSRSFIRGDCNQDNQRDLADVITLLNTLFSNLQAYTPSCIEACDGNDDGQLNIADPIALLQWLFGSPSVPLPYPQVCGPDITPSPLDCSASICP